MFPRRTLLASLYLTCALGTLVFPALLAEAQQTAACERTELADPPRTVYRCANGLILEAEAAARLSFQDGNQGRPMSATLENKAVLIEVEPGSGSFQILTPQAIAAVRGTQYVVDVSEGKTSVFVIRGDVIVSRSGGSEAVSLRPGEGTDVSDERPLTVIVWGQARVSALLSRFAR